MCERRLAALAARMCVVSCKSSSSCALARSPCPSAWPAGSRPPASSSSPRACVLIHVGGAGLVGEQRQLHGGVVAHAAAVLDPDAQRLLVVVTDHDDAQEHEQVAEVAYGRAQ